eukprot:CAMPEP_0201248888 /NCGR_PEP_ID=MMETSP0852-20130820/57999_1 /ASSEMBLY_ACC=CAM_ASM_000632 /TAXON_ID=183588 /ORGANISM="Pseudo-nitzschia fraudulenta, Strain WWA7" /LENGTH=248 /DNA_ID=CAMNT_0047547793 /DNA_START=128 /DNA_END=874 /DNA_ORIENTATION=+
MKKKTSSSCISTSSSRQRVVTKKLQNRERPINHSYPRKRENGFVRSLWDSRSNVITDLSERAFDEESSSTTPHATGDPSEVLAEKKTKHDADRNLLASMKNISLGIEAVPTSKAIHQKCRRNNDFRIAPYVRSNIVAWTDRVFTRIGPNKTERCYHVELKNTLLSEGFDVGYEVALKFERLGSKPVAKRVDLILSMPGMPEKVLVECKAKQKITKKDLEQVIFYQHHFGIPDCYLVNFGTTTEVHKLK